MPSGWGGFSKPLRNRPFFHFSPRHYSGRINCRQRCQTWNTTISMAERMSVQTIVRFIFFALVCLTAPFPATAEDFTNAIHALLQQRVESVKRDISIVIGIVDEHGSSI